MFHKLSSSNLRNGHHLGVSLWMGACAAQAVHAQDAPTTATHVAKTNVVQPVAIQDHAIERGKATNGDGRKEQSSRV
jgi:hypothetical protein